MDGVLIDSELWWPQVEDEFYTALLPKWESACSPDLMGKGAQDIHTYLCEKFDCQLTYDEYLQKYHDMANRVYTHVQMMPQALETLRFFHDSAIATALASSATRQIINTVLERFRLRQYFDTTVSAEDVRMHAKPAPDIYLYTARLLNVLPKHCIAIEDSANGIASAKAAGMYSVAYKTPYNRNQKLDSADVVITDLQQVLTL